MPFIIIETKTEIKPYRFVILDILSKNLNILKVEDYDTKMVLYIEEISKASEDLFLGLASELYADLRVYLSDQEPKFPIDKVEVWFKLIPFMNTVVYDDQLILMERLDFPVNNELKKIVLKTIYEDTELLHTIKVYLESNQNTSKASIKLYLHRNTLIQRLDKFYARTGFDCRNFKDAYIIYSLIK